MTGPKLVPKKKTVARSVYLEPAMWEELTDAAKFHSEVFSLMAGADESAENVSRNDLIDAFLRWALDAYWQEKGGRPLSAKDRADKARKHAEALKRLTSG